MLDNGFKSAIFPLQKMINIFSTASAYGIIMLLEVLSKTNIPLYLITNF